MRLLCMATVAAALFGGVLVSSVPATARMADPGLKLPSATEQIACRTVRERIRRPNGRVVWKTRRICTPGWRRAGRCVTERQRIRRPNGAVVWKTVRRCR